MAPLEMRSRPARLSRDSSCSALDHVIGPVRRTKSCISARVPAHAPGPRRKWLNTSSTNASEALQHEKIMDGGREERGRHCAPDPMLFTYLSPPQPAHLSAPRQTVGFRDERQICPHILLTSLSGRRRKRRFPPLPRCTRGHAHAARLAILVMDWYMYHGEDVPSTRDGGADPCLCEWICSDVHGGLTLSYTRASLFFVNQKNTRGAANRGGRAGVARGGIPHERRRSPLRAFCRVR